MNGPTVRVELSARIQRAFEAAFSEWSAKISETARAGISSHDKERLATGVHAAVLAAVRGLDCREAAASQPFAEFLEKQLSGGPEKPLA